MPVVLETQQAMRPLQRLAFCYLCGLKIEAGQRRTRDHVPPSAIFAVADRDFPLILPTHDKCNHGWTEADCRIGELVGVLHGRALEPGKSKLEFAGSEFSDGSVGAAVRGLDLRSIVRRCIRGFHAALYGEPLDASATAFMTTPPMPEARATGAGAKRVEVAAVVPKFVEEIKRNRLTGTLDRVVCRNGKCRYDCVWSRADDGRYLCIYAFDLYDWKRLGDGVHFDARGCVGAYWPHDEARVPGTATRGTRLEFRVENVDRLDPFGN